jgi:hypothetical protein
LSVRSFVGLFVSLFVSLFVCLYFVLLLTPRYFSEKYDGVRAYWDGNMLYSKYGLPLPVPPEWTKDFPIIPLDGELWYL